MTLTTFNKFYKHYKDTFDQEMRMTKANITYQEAYEQTQKSDEWF